MTATATGSAERWWDSAAVYQIYPRSFQDSNGDGIGDLQGIIDRLDYVQHLGVDAIWLSPFFRSPQRDFGYDISDYCDVAPEYGTLDTWDRLVEAAHARGIRVVIDGVFNHTSDEHPWFVESRASRTNPKADWYIWADGRDAGKTPPNNWRGAMPLMPAWYRCVQRGQWYLATFHRQQPDLNWHHPDVRAAMFGVVRYWLDRGADGFRLDMLPFIMKDPELRSERYRLRLSRSELRVTDGAYTFNTAANYALARELRRCCMAQRGGRDEVMLVGECSGTLAEVARYSAAGDGLTHGFLFDFLMFRFDAGWFRRRIEAYERAFRYPAEPAYVFENHDRSRLLDRVGGDLRKGRLLATVLCTLRGQPTIYQGQELGVTNTYIPLRDARDPMAAVFKWLPEAVNRRLSERVNRDEVRTPMQWDGTPTAGFCAPGVTPWLPLNPNAAQRNVERAAQDPGSMLTLYRDLLALRRRSAALRRGDLAFIPDAPADVLAFMRSTRGEVIAVLCNFSNAARAVPLQPASLLLSSGPGAEVTAGTVRLPPFGAAVLALAGDRSI